MSDNGETAYRQGQSDASRGLGPSPTHNMPAVIADRYTAGHSGK